MTAGYYALKVEQGATLALTITWTDEAGTAINLTGYTARLMARETEEDSSPFITLTTENGGITLGGAAGTIALSMSATATAALTQRKGVYDLELISSGSVVTRLLEGPVVVKRNVTR